MDKVAVAAGAAVAAGRERRGREMNRRGTGRGMDKVAVAAVAGRERRGREMKRERERERNG